MQAIILKKIPIKENDELVVCYTKDVGKASYVAKSIQKRTSKQASHLDILNFVDFNLVHRKGAIHPDKLSESGTAIITSASSINNFFTLKHNLYSMTIAHFVLEVFDKFVFEADADHHLWQFLHDTLYQLDSFSQRSNGIDWNTVLDKTHEGVLGVLGFDKNIDLEAIIGQRLASLSFARQIIGV